MIFGVANKKSVAYHIAKIIADEGGQPIFSVQDEDKKAAVLKLFPGAETFLCDVSDEESIKSPFGNCSQKIWNCSRHCPFSRICQLFRWLETVS